MFCKNWSSIGENNINIIEEDPNNHKNVRKRCDSCPRTNDIKTQNNCSRCENFIILYA